MLLITKSQAFKFRLFQDIIPHGLHSTAFSKFLKWADAQSEARFIWIGVILLAHASFLTPFTVMAVSFTGNSFPLIMGALGAMGLALVTNLAALPTKITIPTFFLSILIDIIIVAIAVFA